MITLVPESWGSPLREHNDCHAPDSGRFCSGHGSSAALDKLKARLQVATRPAQTGFLLPDGTRLRVDIAHKHAAQAIGLSLDEVLTQGAVRYVPYVGVEVGKPLTDTQARILADDWAEYGMSIVVDLVDKNGEIYHSKELHDPSADLIYAVSRRRP